jgi:putative ABC transport system permease protein
MRPRWRKVISDLWDNKVRTALVVVSIAIGVFSVGMIAGAYVIISNDMSESYAASNPANIEINMDPFDDDLVSTIQNIPGVKDAEGRHFVNMRVRTRGGQWISVDLVAVSDFQKSALNLLKPLEGAPIPADRQVLVERDALKKLPLAVGAPLEFQLPDGTIKQMPAIGIALDQSTGAGNFLAPPLMFITLDTLDWLRQPANYNRLFITVSGQPNDDTYIRQISKEVSDKI